MKSRSSKLRRARPLLGTIVEIQTCEGDEAIEAAFEAIAEVQRRMSFHDSTDTLSRLNREAAITPVPVDAWTFEVLETARELNRRSAGVFDVTIAPQLQALGFLPHASRREERVVSFNDVELLPGRCVRFRHTGVRLDLGGIAKGFAVDRAVAALQDAGVSRGLVNAGGDLRAFGDESFPVEIRDPDNPGGTITTVELRDEALATSAHYFSDRLVPGSVDGPFIDPRTGERSAHARSVSVRAPSAMIADALTKVVMLDLAAALPMLEHYHAEAFFVASDGSAVCTPGWSHAALQLSS